MTGREPEEVEIEIHAHLKRKGLLEINESAWKIGYSKLSGRGVIAERDFEPDELVYTDAPLILGPRCHPKHLPMCVVCYKTECTLFSCDKGCGLPVCSDTCQDNPEHENGECSYLRELEPTCGSGWSIELLQTVVPIRILKLPKEERELIHRLEGHAATRHGIEVDMLKKNVKKSIDPEEEEFMRKVCRAMDTNSFETVVLKNDEHTSLRALFPIGGLTNHQCTPNTRHHVNDRGELLVYASMPITKGEEITMSYADVMWDTMMRRLFLKSTKHFDCDCPRCCDPTEGGSMLSALWCAKDECKGYLLPDKPLNYDSPWTCNKCGLVIKGTQILSIRSGITAATEEVSFENPRKILRFVKKELSLLVPETNYVMMDMMFRIVSFFGRSEEHEWKDLSDEELNIKLEYCDKLIERLNALNCGECKKKGLILYELYCTNLEKFRRLSDEENNDCGLSRNEIEESANKLNLVMALRILKNDIATSLDYQKAWQSSLLNNQES